MRGFWLRQNDAPRLGRVTTFNWLNDTMVGMIKGMTVVERVGTAADFEALKGLLAALGFEAGKGWKDAQGEGAAFLAPLGNLELMMGREPAVPRILVETTELESVHGVVKRWAGEDPTSQRRDGGRPDSTTSVVSEVEGTHWNSRLFRLRVGGLEVGFWQSENPLHGVIAATEGELNAEGMKFAVITTRWNTVITDRLLQGALDCLRRSGAAMKDIEVVRVPGAWEIPNAARTIAELGKVDAIVTLGCLLRGETAHYEAIYTEVARGIGQSQQETGVPHAFGVLTCETLEQALDRAGLKAGNKGFEAASAAIEMVSVRRKLKETKADSSAALRNDKQSALRNDKQSSDSSAALRNDKQSADSSAALRNDKQSSEKGGV